MVEFKTKNLYDYVCFSLNKTDADIEDFLNLKKLYLDNVGICNSFTPIYFNELSYFKNLESLTISNAVIDFNNFSYIRLLTNLKSLKLYNCTIDDLTGIANLINLEELNITKGSIKDYKSLFGQKNLKKLSLVNINFEPIIFDYINDLEYLDISYSDINNLESIKLLKHLVTLNIKKTKVIKLDPLIDLKKLKTLYASCELYNNNKDIVHILQNQKVLLFDEYNRLLEGDHNE